MSLDHEWLQSLLDEVAGRLGVVGGQLAIYDGEELAEFATGVANLKTGIEVTPDTLFQIGSTTKPYTAALVMQLVDEGKLDLDAPVKRTLPELKLADAEATERVSCRHGLRRPGPRRLSPLGSGTLPGSGWREPVCERR
jgi:CubicO group peptidase (beta-lactamase class C family)